MNATQPPTPEHAREELARLTPQDRERLLGWLCQSHPALILDAVRDMRDFHERRKGTKP